MENEKKEKLISALIAAGALVLFLVFVLGFTFSHGLCCGDDADLALKAKLLLAGDFQSIYAGFDSHIGVILPIAGLIKLVGTTYWAPGAAIIFIDAILLVVIGITLRRYSNGYGYTLAVMLFFFLNYTFLSQHFEQWFAALGEVPAALLIIAAVMMYSSSEKVGNQVLAGGLLLMAVLTKLAAIIALLSSIAALILLAGFAIFSKDKKGSLTYLSKAGFFSLGLILPLIIFEFFHITQVGLKQNINRVLNSLSYGLSYLEQHSVQNFIPDTLSKNAVFSERFGIPFLLFLGLILLAGWLIRKHHEMIKVYYPLFAILVFYSAWWFYFSIGWGRHYVIPFIIGIFLLVLPLIALEKKNIRAIYLLVIVACTAFSWQSFGYPVSKLEGNFFKPTEATRALISLPELFTEYQDGDLVLTKRHGTFESIQYITDQNLKINYYKGDQQYAPPLWIAIKTDWLAVNEDFLQYANKKEFKRFLSRCRGLHEMEGYIVGQCQ